MRHLDACDELEVEIERFAHLLDDADVTAPVPTCPDWDVGALSEHLGRIHRWAERLVATRSATRLSLDPDDVGAGPFDASWLRDGGALLVSTLRSTEPDAPVWAWGADQYVRFWSRRQLHETLIHRVDLEMALGLAPVVDSVVAEDCVDEFLANLKAAERFSPRVRELRGDGEVLRLTATDRPRSWNVRFDESGFVVTQHVDVDVDAEDAALAGSAEELALVLTRRRGLSDSALIVSGDSALVERWLQNSAIE